MKKGDRVEINLPNREAQLAMLGEPANEEKSIWFCSVIEQGDEGEVLQQPQAITSKYIKSLSK